MEVAVRLCCLLSIGVMFETFVGKAAALSSVMVKIGMRSTVTFCVKLEFGATDVKIPLTHERYDQVLALFTVPSDAVSCQRVWTVGKSSSPSILTLVWIAVTDMMLKLLSLGSMPTSR